MKKILISLAIIGVVAAIGVGATVAYFSDTETSTGNTISAGTIDISVDNNSVWGKTYTDVLTDMKPGYVRYINFVVKNTGENPARVWKHLGSFATLTGIVSEPECTDQGGTWDNINGTCGTFADKNDIDNVITYDMYVCLGNDTTCLVDTNGKPTGSNWNVIINENDGIMIGDMESAWFDLMEWRPSQKTLLSGEEIKVSQSYYMQPTAGNEYQGDTLTFNIDLKAQQSNAPEITSGTLLLENKDTSWNIVKGDGIWGVLKFNASGSTFDYELKTAGLNNTLSYNLVYYDTTEHVIDSLGTPTGGVITKTGSININADLDGVKVWVRPTPWSSISDANTLWEYNLISYDDTDV
jgi:predicted ribosomally synthesized peptide with SipW-like signal peptide